MPDRILTSRPPVGLHRTIALELLGLVLAIETDSSPVSARAQCARLLAGQLGQAVTPLSYEDREGVEAARRAWVTALHNESADALSSQLTERLLSDAKERRMP